MSCVFFSFFEIFRFFVFALRGEFYKLSSFHHEVKGLD